MTQTLLIATSNQGKLKEIRTLLSDLSFNVIDLNEAGLLEHIEESGNSFVENASLKASGYALRAGLLTLADDSGLMIDALGGAPGIYSARYAGENSSDSERTRKVLAALADVPETGRSARFVCAVAISDAAGKIIDVSVGECRGRVAFRPDGEQGFGYDPIFIPDGYNVTFGKIDPVTKNRISHRGRALAKSVMFLTSLTDTFADG